MVIAAKNHDNNELNLFFCALGHGLERVARLDAEMGQHVCGFVDVEIGIKILKEVEQIIRCHPIAEIGALRQIGDNGMCFDAWHIARNANFSG